MAQIIKEIRVDVSQPCNLQAILAKQYDCNSRFLKITLTDCGTKIDVSNTSKVTINTNRPDGQSKSFVGIANGDGTVTVPLPQWSLSIAGTLICDVSVTDISKNERLTTMDIFVEVKEAANDNTDVSENPDGEIIVITPTKKISENSTDNEYPSAKAVYDLDNITATATGNAITIDSANAPLQNLKLYGSTTQDGTPTPDAPIPLVSVGDSGSFKMNVFGGKNFLEVTETTTTINGITFTVNADKSVTVAGTATSITTFYLSNAIKENLCIGVEYYVAGVNALQIIKTDGTISYVGGGKTFTVTSDMKYIKPYLQVASGSTVNVTYYSMVVLATETDTTWETYKGKQTLTMPYTLASAKNNARSEIDLTKGKVIELAHKEVFDGSDDEKWETLSNNRVSITVDSMYAPNGDDLYNPGNILCSVANICSWATLENATSGCALGSTTSRRIGFKIVGHTESVDAWKSYLASNPITVVYELKKPIETPLTETELNAYRQLMTDSGTTTILSEADAEIEYYRNTPNGQATGNIHTQVNADYFKLQQAIITTGGSTL